MAETTILQLPGAIIAFMGYCSKSLKFIGI
jgi:hypothetical protein